MRVAKWRRTTFIVWGLGSFLIGLGFARRFSVDGIIVLATGLFWLITLRKKSPVSLASLCVFMTLFGLWRGTVFMQKIFVYKDLTKQSVVITGTADSDAIYSEKSQLSFDITHVQVQDPIQQQLVGKIGIKGYGENMVYKGDQIQVEGKLYPTRGSRQAIISFADISITQSSGSKVESFRRNFATGLTSALPEPLASFGLGLLIGQRTTLPKDLTDQLSVVGLTHIVAVSGYNLTIIILAVQKLLGKRSKYQASLLTVLLIGSFLMVTGFSASIVRAAIVSLLSLAAWYYGRTFKPLVVLLLAAVLTAGWYPVYIWSDLGWWLSFLAFAGILVAVPLAQKRFLKGKEPKLVASVLLETFAALLLTLPLTMYIFGKLSLVALVANALVVPLVPIAMLASFVAGLAGMWAPQLAGWVAWPAKLVLGYMVDLVRAMAAWPHASVGQSIRLPQMLILYGLIVVLLLTWRTKTGIITDRKRRIKQETLNVRA